MMNFSQAYAALRKNNRKNYLLLLGCNLFSVLLISFFSIIMQSNTIQDVLPTGGDSRKMMSMIFVLAVIGCGVFTTYASSLFFRSKSRENGIFLSLGAKRSQLQKLLFQDLSKTALVSCVVGLALSFPVSCLIWWLFRKLIVDSEEMVLSVNPVGFLWGIGFAVFTVLMLFTMGYFSLKQTNILEVLNEQKKQEKMRLIKPWYGPVGIVLLITGGFSGYIAPTISIKIFHYYPPAIINLLYVPAIIGLYMILIHTVVNGWSKSYSRSYLHIITRSMMKFQGRQTVRNMMVVAVLTAGAFFALFYIPSVITGFSAQNNAQYIDYLFHYRNDQKANMPKQNDIEQLAQKHGISLSDYSEIEVACLVTDGYRDIVSESEKIDTAYLEIYGEEYFISESNFQHLSGISVDVAPGTFLTACNTDDDVESYFRTNDITKIYNPVSMEGIDVSFAGTVQFFGANMGMFVLDDSDYQSVSQNLPADWSETWVAFNSSEDNYDFAKELRNQIIDASGPEVEICDAYDRIKRERDIREKGEYFLDSDPSYLIDYDKRQSSNFTLYWKFIPMFRILNEKDLMTNMAVYLMLFVFISIICFAAVFVILYTRCLTLAMNNKQVYLDVGKLGASPRYLYESVRDQIQKIIFVPVVIGTAVIFAFYGMILYFNSNSITFPEIQSMGMNLLLGSAIMGLIYLLYRYILKQACRIINLPIPRSKKR